MDWIQYIDERQERFCRYLTYRIGKQIDVAKDKNYALIIYGFLSLLLKEIELSNPLIRSIYMEIDHLYKLNIRDPKIWDDLLNRLPDIRRDALVIIDADRPKPQNFEIPRPGIWEPLFPFLYKPKSFTVPIDVTLPLSIIETPLYDRALNGSPKQVLSIFAKLRAYMRLKDEMSISEKIKGIDLENYRLYYPTVFKNISALSPRSDDQIQNKDPKQTENPKDTSQHLSNIIYNIAHIDKADFS
ncbi:MAG: hypothetical protein SF053_03030 [Bacteroidia bacterium]|nr:hypothetical protein [Bacteroidia bacterium]